MSKPLFTSINLTISSPGTAFEISFSCDEILHAIFYLILKSIIMENLSKPWQTFPQHLKTPSHTLATAVKTDLFFTLTFLDPSADPRFLNIPNPTLMLYRIKSSTPAISYLKNLKKDK